MSELGPDGLCVEDLRLRQGKFELRGSFRAPAPGVTVVFGPSGAGKSSLLRVVAGLERPASGVVRYGDKVLEDVATGVRRPPHARDIGMVFQDSRLFPHLTVLGNLEYAVRRCPAGRTRPDVSAIAEEVEISHLLERPVGRLSGGERSRVALARALVSAPRLLLLDEPFAALDGRLRRSFVSMLGEVAKRQSIPMLVVTHLIDDAVELADHVVALRDGEIVAAGSADEVMAGGVFGDLLDRRDHGVRLTSGALADEDSPHAGKGVWLRADNVLVAAEAPRGLSARNVWPGKLAGMEVEPDGAVVLRLACDVGTVLARVTAAAVRDLALEVDQPIWAVVKTHAV